MPLRQMEPEDLSALVEAGEVHEEDLIEPSLSQELSWKRSHVVGGGDHEHPRGAVLHPSQEPSQKPMAGAPVSLVPCRSIPPTESRVTPEGTTSSASPESSRSAFAVWRKATSVPSSTPSFSAACLDESPGLRDGEPPHRVDQRSPVRGVQAHPRRSGRRVRRWFAGRLPRVPLSRAGPRRQAPSMAPWSGTEDPLHPGSVRG